jgi:ElaB/YqjD/DUF883 family membrane-anchored ribosome-binding protein
MPEKSRSAQNSASLSEAQILQKEAARARAAISEAFSDLSRNLKATVDPHGLTRDHPWLAVSGAAVAGFVAAVTLIPSKEQQAMRALAELERARNAPPAASAPASDNPARSGSILGTIAAEALKTLRPLLTAVLSASIAQASGGAAGDKGGVASSGGAVAAENGHSAEEQISSPS